MDSETPGTEKVDMQNGWIIRTGAISAFAVVVGYLVTFPLYAMVGEPPMTGIEAQLEYFGSHAGGWWVITGLMIVSDFLLLPLFLALYWTLKAVGRDLMLLAIACIGLFVALDLAVTWTSYSVLIVAGSDYVAAGSSTAKVAIAASAAYPAAILRSPMAGMYATTVPALGILLTGLVMLRGVFNKPTAYVALTAGVAGIAFMSSYVVEALAPLRYINALLMTAAYVLAGIRLYRFGWR